ncbi:unnamed protein product [Rhizophagus irregularis]|nr:unnamed protein product [Rhizophagus irregularis]
MTPDPFVPGQKVTFDIKGTMKYDIFIDDFFGIVFFDLVEKHPIGNPLIVDTCILPGVNCTVKAGTAISTTVDYLAPGAKELPKSYAIIIAISHGNEPLVITLACSIAIFGASKLPAVPADLDFWGFL